MNCLEFRRWVLTAPRRITAGQQAHLECCARCAEFAQSVAHDEAAIEQAMLVPVPEGLAERVLLRHGIRGPSRWSTLALTASLPFALAASLLVAVGVAFYSHEAPRQSDEIVSAQLPGANQHAVAAISYVLDHEPRLLKENRARDPQVMRAALSELGLSLPANLGSVRYLGNGVLPDGSRGEHIVLQTPYGHVTLILMPDHQFFASRVTVSDRNLQALAASRRGGCYVLVADSAQTLKRVEEMLL